MSLSPYRALKIAVSLILSGILLMYVYRSKITNESRMDTTQPMEKDTNDINIGKIIVFNRIPKCGSTTIISLLRRLSKRNKFNLFLTSMHGEEIVSETEFTNFLFGLSTVFNEKGERKKEFKDMIYVKHQHYIPMPHTISRNITYINIMRDPVKRFISGYYFWRFSLEYFLSVNQTIQTIDTLQLPFLYKIIDRKWLDENIRTCHDCEDKRLYFLRDFDILETLNKSFSSWLKKNLSHCIMNKEDEECNDFSETRRLHVIPSDIVIKHHAGEDNLLDKNSVMNPPFSVQTSLPYFCGTDIFCRNIDNKEAIDKAIQNIQNDFEVVGIIEKVEMTLRVLEHKLPRFFKGAREEYNALIKEGNQNVYKQNYVLPSEKELKVLKDNLNGEYRLYSYAQKRLDHQFNELTMANQKSGGDIRQELDGALKQRTK